MRRSVSCALLLSLAAMSGAQSVADEQLEKFNKALSSAQALSVACTVRPGGGAGYEYKLELAKPNLVKIDAPDEQIVADGTAVTILNKRLNVYLRRKQTDAELKRILQPGELVLWAGFFGSKAAGEIKNVDSRDAETRNGITYNVVEFASSSPGHEATLKCLLKPDDSMASAAEITARAGRTQSSFALDVTSVSIGQKADPAKCAFQAPSGSRELTVGELSVWYTSVDAALQAAKSTDRMLMLYLWKDS